MKQITDEQRMEISLLSLKITHMLFFCGVFTGQASFPVILMLTTGSFHPGAAFMTLISLAGTLATYQYRQHLKSKMAVLIDGIKEKKDS